MLSTIALTATTLQVLTAVISIFFINKNKTTFFYILTIILCVTAIIEVLGAYFITIERNSLPFYIIYTFIIFNLIAFLYSKILKTRNNLMLIIPTLIFNFLFFIFYLFEISHFKVLIIGSINTSFYILLYLKQLLISDEIINFKKLLPFWISISFLIYYLPSIPFFSLLHYMTNRGLFFILDVLIILMNSFIIYGILTCNKEEKY